MKAPLAFLVETFREEWPGIASDEGQDDFDLWTPDGPVAKGRTVTTIESAEAAAEEFADDLAVCDPKEATAAIGELCPVRCKALTMKE